MADKWLAIVDADGIQEYIFSAHELRLIRGGSGIQRRLSGHAGKQLARKMGGEVIVSNGGTVLAIFEGPGAEAAADAYGRAATRLYVECSGEATATAAKAVYPAGGFGQAWRELRRNLELSKRCGPRVRFNGVGPFWSVCQCCGIRPAVSKATERKMCQACLLRDAAGERERGSQGPLPPRDFGFLGEQGQPENYLVLVYLDLDRMGAWLESDVVPDDAPDHFSLRRLSSAVDRSVRRCVRRACLETAGVIEEEEARYYGFEVLLAGGDDAVVMLPAQFGFPFVDRFREHYAAERKRFGLPTFSASLVFAHSHFPIAEFFRIAKILNVSAKSVKGEDSIDYEILTESLVGDPVERREKALVTGGGKYRTAKPYKVEEFRALRKGVAAIRERVALSKLRSLYALAYDPPVTAETRYLHLLARLDGESRRELLRVVGQHLWQEDEQGIGRTNAADVAELLEFTDDFATEA